MGCRRPACQCSFTRMGKRKGREGRGEQVASIVFISFLFASSFTLFEPLHLASSPSHLCCPNYLHLCMHLSSSLPRPGAISPFGRRSAPSSPPPSSSPQTFSMSSHPIVGFRSPPLFPPHSLLTTSFRVVQITAGEPLLRCQNTLGEGPVWDSSKQLLHWVDIEKVSRRDRFQQG